MTLFGPSDFEIFVRAKLIALQNKLSDLGTEQAHIHNLIHGINQKVERLMSKVSEYAEAAKAAFAEIATGLDGLEGDLTRLAAKIEELQNSSGGITPEDQALLDEVQALAVAAKDRVASLDAKNALPPPPAG